jgi:hypothetical protein
MTQNLWKLAGKPTSFNPLATGYPGGNGITLDIGDYTINFKAKSALGARIFVDRAAVPIGDPFFDITADSKSYTTSFNIATKQVVYLVDANGKGDIVIDSIELVKQALPALPTLHNLARSRRVGALTAETSFTDEKILSLSKVSVNGNPATKQSTATIKANFDGKVAGNTDLIPHKTYRNSINKLPAPSARAPTQKLERSVGNDTLLDGIASLSSQQA